MFQRREPVLLENVVGRVARGRFGQPGGALQGELSGNEKGVCSSHVPRQQLRISYRGTRVSFAPPPPSAGSAVRAPRP